MDEVETLVFLHEYHVLLPETTLDLDGVFVLFFELEIVLYGFHETNTEVFVLILDHVTLFGCLLDASIRFDEEHPTLLLGVTKSFFILARKHVCDIS